MIGAGTLSRILVRIGGRLLDRLGILPQRLYLRDALEALSKDDFPRVIRSLKRGHRGHSQRWELIRQQAIFRCRILKETHVKTLHRLERLHEARYFEELPKSDVKQAVDLNRLAIRILSGYETNLQRLTH